MNKVTFGKKTIDLTHIDKIIFPKNNITKNEVINYYKNIAKYLLPNIKERPLTINFFPRGIGNQGFIRQHADMKLPGWFQTVKLEKITGGTVEHFLCNDQASLVYLANQNMVAIHRWLSKKSNIKYPDQIILDLDPPENRFDLVVKAAKLLRPMLEEVSYKPNVLLTGSKGIHVIVNITQKITFDKTREILADIAQKLAANYPEDFTTEIRKEKRHNALYLDLSRNAYGQTAIAPYSLRATEEASIAMPISWEELDDKNLTSRKYNIKNIFDHLAKSTKDPWDN